MKRPRILNPLYRLIMGDGFDVKHKLQNMLLAISIVGSGVSVIVAFILNSNLESKLLALGAIIMEFIAFYVSAVRKNRKAGTLIVFVVINIILFPLLFLTNGGVFSGMPIWLAFGLIYPWLVSEGAMCIVMFVINTVVTIACFCFQYFCPEYFIIPSAEDLTKWVVMDSVQVAIIVAAVLGMAIKYQVYVKFIEL